MHLPTSLSQLSAGTDAQRHFTQGSLLNALTFSCNMQIKHMFQQLKRSQRKEGVRLIFLTYKKNTEVWWMEPCILFRERAIRLLNRRQSQLVFESASTQLNCRIFIFLSRLSFYILHEILIYDGFFNNLIFFYMYILFHQTIYSGAMTLQKLVIIQYRVIHYVLKILSPQPGFRELCGRVT